ncbi:MAG: hypothetical protein JSV79_10925 [Armatimonadota bacterium]|nr:MAG: hypothetical protein JSV79_10925 [Armatimonadota bacterium]
MGTEIGQNGMPSEHLSRARAIELSVETVPPNLEQARCWRDVRLTLGAWEAERGPRVSELPSGTRLFELRLHDSSELINWEPGDEEESSGAGRVFAEVLRSLYDGREWRLCLLPGSSLTLATQTANLLGEEASWEEMQDAEGRVLQGMALRLAFMLVPEEAGIKDPQAVPVDYWWCPKTSLRDAVGAAWDMGCEGYVAPRADSEIVRQCLLRSTPADVVAGLLESCRLVFQTWGEGESMLILSRSASEEGVRRAADSPAVRRALGELSQVARFKEWKPVADTPGPGRWRRKV